jgi:hypothetical protein
MSYSKWCFAHVAHLFSSPRILEPTGVLHILHIRTMKATIPHTTVWVVRKASADKASGLDR